MQDSTGKTIAVGDRVRWARDQRTYTIRQFLPGQGRSGTAGIQFEEPCARADYLGELPDEWSVDLVAARWRR